MRRCGGNVAQAAPISASIAASRLFVGVDSGMREMREQSARPRDYLWVSGLATICGCRFRNAGNARAERACEAPRGTLPLFPNAEMGLATICGCRFRNAGNARAERACEAPRGTLPLFP